MVVIKLLVRGEFPEKKEIVVIYDLLEQKEKNYIINLYHFHCIINIWIITTDIQMIISESCPPRQ